MEVNHERSCDLRRDQIIQGKTHRNEGSFLGKFTTPSCDQVFISLQTMQDINLAIGVDEISTEVLMIKRYTKCQFVMSNPICPEYLESDPRCFSGQDIGPSQRMGAFRGTPPLPGTNTSDTALRRTAYDDQEKPDTRSRNHDLGQ